MKLEVYCVEMGRAADRPMNSRLLIRSPAGKQVRGIGDRCALEKAARIISTNSCCVSDAGTVTHQPSGISKLAQNDYADQHIDRSGRPSWRERAVVSPLRLRSSQHFVGPPAKICTNPALGPNSVPIYHASVSEPVRSKIRPSPNCDEICQLLSQMLSQAQKAKNNRWKTDISL